MPLNPSKLYDGILAVCKTPAPSSAACAQQWADAIVAYAKTIVPASATVDGAGPALAATLVPGFSVPGGGPAALEAGLKAFAVTVASGMAGFVAVPPPGPVGFAALVGPPAPETHEAAAQRVATLIDVWFRTGTATVPPGATTNWN